VREELDRLAGRVGREGFAAWLEDLSLELERDRENDVDEGSTAKRRDDPSERELDLAVLSRVGSDYLALDADPGAEGFPAYLRQILRDDPQAPASDGIDLLTFHRAKGLEWRVVFVTGIEDGLVPIAHAKTAAALEEERRLLYVALSRATQELHCSWSQRRAFGHRASRREPSPFLPAVMEACRSVENARAFDLDRAKAAIAATRSQLDLASPTERELTSLPNTGAAER
jgi:superfamily I DNA/RNA helicase